MLKLAEKMAHHEVREPQTTIAPETVPRRGKNTTVVGTLVEQLAGLGVEQAFGISGGAVALLFDALAESSIALHHFRHETGAAFAATEAYFARRKPTVVFATTGPGLLNSLTGLTAARWEGAKVILISGSTSSPQRGRWATQETSSYTMPQDGLFTKGPIFDFALRMEHPAELPEVLRRLSLGLAKPGGFVAHVSLPMGVQSQRFDERDVQRPMHLMAPAISEDDIAFCARQLKPGSFAIWAGFGATQAAQKVRLLSERSGAKVFCSPRGKGIMPEDHRNYLGVTGLGGHDQVTQHMVAEAPQRILVLGSRLGEATSFWDNDMVPSEGFLHVDIDPEVPGTAFPDAKTLAIQSEVGQFLDALLRYFPNQAQEQPIDIETHRKSKMRRRKRVPTTPAIELRQEGPVRPQALMNALQRQVVEDSDAVVLAECGNSFAWCNHYLRFREAGRYRVSTLFGSMGHAAAGVVGAALSRGDKALAVVGDGSMLMNSEVSTAVQYGAKAVWLVLNDAAYGMCRDGHKALGLTNANVHFPRVDFVAMAGALGAKGLRIDKEADIEEVLSTAMKSEVPVIIDARIDPSEPSPLLQRFESLIKQGNSKNVAGWESDS